MQLVKITYPIPTPEEAAKGLLMPPAVDVHGPILLSGYRSFFK